MRLADKKTIIFLIIKPELIKYIPPYKRLNKNEF